MVNWLKVLANGGVAFFTTVGGVRLAGIDLMMALQVAVVPALISAGVAMSKELIEESQKTTKKNPSKKGSFLWRVLNYVTIF